MGNSERLVVTFVARLDCPLSDVSERDCSCHVLPSFFNGGVHCYFVGTTVDDTVLEGDTDRLRFVPVERSRVVKNMCEKPSFSGLSNRQTTPILSGKNWLTLTE